MQLNDQIFGPCAAAYTKPNSYHEAWKTYNSSQKIMHFYMSFFNHSKLLFYIKLIQCDNWLERFSKRKNIMY